MLSLSSIERILVVVMSILEAVVRVLEKYSPEPESPKSAE